MPGARTFNGMRQALLVVAALAFAGAALAKPAPWYRWSSKLTGQTMCSQTSPGAGWEQDSAAYEGPGCQPRSKVLVVPMR